MKSPDVIGNVRRKWEGTTWFKVLVIGSVGAAALTYAAVENFEVDSAKYAPTKTAKPPKVPAPWYGTLICRAPSPDKWQPIPANFNIPLIAKDLGVSQQTLEQNGLYGGATCGQDISASEAFGTNATVGNIGQACMTIGLESRPEPHKEYDDVLAVCIEGK